MTSRIESIPRQQRADPVPAERDAAVRGRAVRERVEQEPELLLLPAFPSPIIAKTRCCTARSWIRIDPPPISLPLQTQVVRVGQGVPGSASNRSIHSGFGDVNAWCTAVHAPVPTATSPPAVARGAGLEQRRVDHPHERPRGLVDQPATAPDLQPSSSEQRPGARDLAGAEEHAVAGVRADVVGQARRARRRTGSSRPARRARRPRRPARTPGRCAPRCLAHSCQASRTLRGCDAPPGMTTAPTYGAWNTRNAVSAKNSVHSTSSSPNRRSGLSCRSAPSSRRTSAAGSAARCRARRAATGR